MHVFLKLPTFLSLLIITAATTSLTLAGLYLVRRKYPLEKWKENHEVAAIIFGAFGWLYAVIVAFVVFVTWTGYDEANKNMQLEASQALDIFSGADAFTEPVRSQVRNGIIAYIEEVRSDELPKMAGENMALYTMPSLRELDRILARATASTVRNSELYAASLRRLDDLKDYRRLRIFSGRKNVPSLIWLVLLLGGVIMIANTFFFAMKNVGVQALMVAALNITLTLVLYLIFVLNHPFTGTNRASDEPLRQALAMMKDNVSRGR